MSKRSGPGIVLTIIGLLLLVIGVWACTGPKVVWIDVALIAVGVVLLLLGGHMCAVAARAGAPEAGGAAPAPPPTPAPEPVPEEKAEEPAGEEGESKE